MLVSVEYRARPGQEDQLMAALQGTKNARRRTGATAWRTWQDASDPGRILEQFVVASWDEHLRQHERVTRRDQDHIDRVRELADPARPVTVTHWLAASPQPPSPVNLWTSTSADSPVSRAEDLPQPLQSRPAIASQLRG